VLLQKNQIIIKNINKIFVCGDLHGEMEISKLNGNNFPDQKDLKGNNILIQVGDFGLIWDNNEKNKTERYWLEWLDKKPFYTLFIAGNHENYNRLEQYPLIDFCNGKAAQISNKVFYLKNGYVYDFDHLKFWMFGGAESIDKLQRRIGISWWSEEVPSYKEMQFGLDELEKYNYEVDYIITHTMPKLMIDRFTRFVEKANCPVSKYLDTIFERIRGSYKKWLCGHFHIDEKLDENMIILYNNILRIK